MGWRGIQNHQGGEMERRLAFCGGGLLSSTWGNVDRWEGSHTRRNCYS